ncbi:MAG: T9SS type A sorting domain-containing protein [Bacteroidota bacterium]
MKNFNKSYWLVCGLLLWISSLQAQGWLRSVGERDTWDHSIVTRIDAQGHIWDLTGLDGTPNEFSPNGYYTILSKLTVSEELLCQQTLQDFTGHKMIVLPNGLIAIYGTVARGTELRVFRQRDCELVSQQPYLEQASIIDLELAPNGDLVLSSVSKEGARNNRYFSISRTRETGAIRWSRTYSSSSQINSNATDHAVSPAGHTLSAIGTLWDTAQPPLSSMILLHQHDRSGRLLWKDSLFFRTELDSLQAEELEVEDVQLTPTTDGHLLHGHFQYTSIIEINGSPATVSEERLFVIKLSSSGAVEWRKILPAADFIMGPAHRLVAAAEPDEWYLLRWTTDIDNIPFDIRLMHFNSDGDILWDKDYPNIRHLFRTSIELLFHNNELYIHGGATNLFFSDYKSTLAKLSADGNLIWSETTELSEFYYFITRHLHALPDGGFLANGTLTLSQGGLPNDRNSLLMKMNSRGEIYTNTINGRLCLDEDFDCEGDSTLAGDLSWIVQLNNQRIATTRPDGSFVFRVDTGQFQLQANPLSEYWITCPLTLDLPQAQTDTSVCLSVQIDEFCPAMEVFVAANRVRPCFSNAYNLYHCNSGTDTAQQAYVELLMDDLMTYDSSSIPLDSQVGQLLTFQLGDVAPGECESFQVWLGLDCESEPGSVQCVEAHIYPDSSCIPPGSDWSGASVVVDAFCQRDTVNFQIQNVGVGNMNMPSTFIVIEDQVVLRSGSFQLNAGEDSLFQLPARGATYRIEAMQVPGHPGRSMPSAMVDHCGPGNGLRGFFGQYPLDELDGWIDIECVVATNAYDPNDKQATPQGYGPQNFIAANQDLEYTIRFQNTGTDTAFTVVIRDTIDQHLDIQSIRPGASSHSYDFRIETDSIAVFIFNNILLPDSNVNQDASNGFVRFHIRQQADLEDGVEISNWAAIYFDFNDPIITNTVWHVIGSDYLADQTVAVHHPDPSPNAIVPSPNPMQHSTLFRLGDESTDELMLRLYDLQGHLLYQQTHLGPQIQLLRPALPAGMYLYQLQQAEKTIGQGKLILLPE